MKKFFVLSAVTVAIVSMSFAVDNAREPQKTCEYEFNVKCANSSQFTEVIRAKDHSTAKTMCINRYKDCKVYTKDSGGKNCK